MSYVGKKIKTAGSNIIKNDINTKISAKRKYSNNKIKINPQNNNENINLKNNNNQKNKKPSTSNINQREKNLLLLESPNGIAGNGLWCQISKKNNDIQEKTYESIIPKIKKDSDILLDPEKEAYKKLISELKFQVKDLTLKLEQINIKYSDAEFRAQRAENLHKIAMDELDTKKSEYNDIHENARSLENNFESLNEALNNAKKEIARLRNELNSQIDINKSLNQKIEELLKEKDKNSHFNSEEIIKMQKNISQLNIEKENLIKIIQNRTNKDSENNSDVLSLQIKEKDNLLKSMEITMNKALNENAELKKKLNNEESAKLQLNNIITKKNEINEDLKSQLEEMKTYIDSNLKEVKWNKSIVNQKDSNIKIMKEKLKQKDEEIKKLNDEINSLNKKLNKKKDEIKKENKNEIKNEKNNLMNNQQKIVNNKDGTKEIIIPVKANPFLFGPEPSEFEYVDEELEKDIFGKFQK